MKNYRHSIRSKSTGRFIPIQSAVNVVAGRLYSFKGVPCRARQRVNAQEWYVTSHKALSGIVAEADLRLIDKKTVKNYLKNA